ncbi:hypothetical protein AWC38_SpisGene7621 [Stylophora pistillata]|uniref:Uncharacterized protein n=2 Tax=Stylophora pistillata TaxID=50429 RepID=A0A2B4SGN8_STYPI|nr:hypothetical protein AWC38_SpisGene7621 [Stylophora pistillata]
MPARKGLSYEQTTCRVTRREIFCETNNCSECSPGRNSAGSLCLRVYVLCGDHDETVNKNLSSYREGGYLLRKDVYHLNDKCTRKLKPICSDPAPTPNGLEDFQVGEGRTGPTYQCYRNPNVPNEVVYENHSKEHYRKVVLHSVLWPTALIGLSIVILTAAMCFCPMRRDYRKIP